MTHSKKTNGSMGNDVRLLNEHFLIYKKDKNVFTSNFVPVSYCPIKHKITPSVDLFLSCISELVYENVSWNL